MLYFAALMTKPKYRLAFLLLATLLFGGAVAFTFYYFNTHLPYRPLVLRPGISKDSLLYNLPHGMYIDDPKHDPRFSVKLASGGPEKATLGFRNGKVVIVVVGLPNTALNGNELASKFLVRPLKLRMTRDKVEKLLKAKHVVYSNKSLEDVSALSRELMKTLDSPWIVSEADNIIYTYYFTGGKLTSVGAYFKDNPLAVP